MQSISPRYHSHSAGASVCAFTFVVDFRILSIRPPFLSISFASPYPHLYTHVHTHIYTYSRNSLSGMENGYGLIESRSSVGAVARARANGNRLRRRAAAGVCVCVCAIGREMRVNDSRLHARASVCRPLALVHAA